MARAEERLQNETEQQPDAWVNNSTEGRSLLSDTARADSQGIISACHRPATGNRTSHFYRGMSSAKSQRKRITPLARLKTRLELGLEKNI